MSEDKRGTGLMPLMYRPMYGPTDKRVIGGNYKGTCGKGCDSGIKVDTKKTRLDLIPPEAIELIGQAFTHGAKKYGDHNYRKGIKYSRLYAATLRHLNAHWGGEDIDEDSGLHHLALAGAEICMLIVMGMEYDDRYSPDKISALPSAEQDSEFPVEA